MALETLKDVKEIDGFKTVHIEEDGTYPKGLKNSIEYKPICIDHRSNILSFKIQDGPIKENGVNGCQVGTLIAAAKLIIEGLNEKFPCIENDNAIAGLNTALKWLRIRKKDRENRGVEGTNQC